MSALLSRDSTAPSLATSLRADLKSTLSKVFLPLPPPDPHVTLLVGEDHPGGQLSWAL